MSKLLIAAVLATGVVGGHIKKCSGKPKYSVTMDSLYDPLTSSFEPMDFGPLVGLTHDFEFNGFGIGEMASPGIIEVALTAQVGTIMEEMEKEGKLVGPNVGPYMEDDEEGLTARPTDSSQTLYFEVEDKKSIASFMMGVIPPENWFLVGGADLCDGTTGEWKEFIMGNPQVYDAGNGEDSRGPARVISQLSMANMASFTFKLLTKDEAKDAKKIIKSNKKLVKEYAKEYKEIMNDFKEECEMDAKKLFEAMKDAAFADEDAALEAADLLDSKKDKKAAKKEAKKMRKTAVKAAKEVQDSACDMFD